MEYRNIARGTFISRPNRFIAKVNINSKEASAHVANTGRLGELLIPGTEVFLEDHIDNMGNRKMRYSLRAVSKNGQIVNIDSQAPNKLVMKSLSERKIILPGMGILTEIRPEKKFGNSRFDFYAKDCDGIEAFIEVKGCTLNDNGIARFPDAPSERAVKHIGELITAIKSGYRAYVIFICTMKGISSFEPNRETHPEFADILTLASSENVNILCFDCNVSPDQVSIDSPIPVIL